jgi:hypothetical protein
VSPEVASPGTTLTFTAKVQGTATSVTINGGKRTDAAVTFTLPLVEGASAGGVTTWSATTSALTTTGQYGYSAIATATDGTTVEMPGVSGWTFCVGNPATDCG